MQVALGRYQTCRGNHPRGILGDLPRGCTVRPTLFLRWSALQRSGVLPVSLGWGKSGKVTSKRKTRKRTIRTKWLGHSHQTWSFLLWKNIGKSFCKCSSDLPSGNGACCHGKRQWIMFHRYVTCLQGCRYRGQSLGIHLFKPQWIEGAIGLSLPVQDPSPCEVPGFAGDIDIYWQCLGWTFCDF